MTRTNLYLDKYDWMIRAYINAEAEDVQEVLATIRELGGSRSEVARAAKNMRPGAKNNGLCFPIYHERLSIIVIGGTTSAQEFLDSLVHEVMHLAIHIAGTYAIDLRGEEPCYIAGDIARELYPFCKRYLCCHCNK